jgi:hypothetical protein
MDRLEVMLTRVVPGLIGVGAAYVWWLAGTRLVAAAEQQDARLGVRGARVSNQVIIWLGFASILATFAFLGWPELAFESLWFPVAALSACFAVSQATALYVAARTRAATPARVSSPALLWFILLTMLSVAWSLGKP